MQNFFVRTINLAFPLPTKPPPPSVLLETLSLVGARLTRSTMGHLVKLSTGQS